VADPNGLSTPAVVDVDGNGTADYAYAGDLRGNVWKFDLTSSSDGSWNRAFGGPFFTAVDSLGNAQPITSAVEVTRHPNGGLMVLFGTGQYLQNADVPSVSVQSLYGVRDAGAAVSGRADLVQQTVTDVATISGSTYRAVSNNAVNYATKKGWYLDLPGSGERVVVDPILRNGRFIVATTVPNADPCSAGGSSWLMEVDYLGGGRLNKAVFDVNVNGGIDGTDIAVFPSGTVHASAVRLDAISSSPSVVRGFGTDGNLENKYLNQSSGGIARVLESGEALSNRRTSWRELP
jgi:type IV pilus assembly protein PilY1